ncbi:cation diffusion facilitator family transporter [uncultured Ruminococcus sp.]|uniref:cation diffusion facilitator family transporter n=1 Tax=uncultured Ruminococcus sp. TaxID=165186 RepID=UPI00260C2672|nr:cation diffusion facilitator family transporter [uncultured Ruminococcus sp.]
MEREKVIVKTSLVGVLTNILLAGFKAAVGAVTGSIAVVLDAINNLSDVLSSVVTIIGTKLAGKKPDKEHPLGHGRAEYIGTMIVAAIILYAGIAAGVESVKKIISPTKPDYSMISLIIVGTAVVVKIVLGRYVSAMGKKVNSGSLIASGSDALFDAVVSASVLLSALICKFWGINLEAYVGLLIAVFIIRAGVGMMRDTVDDILGKRIDRELVESVRGTICENENVSGAYDLILHSYGPNKLIGSVHVEIPADMSACEIDRMERNIAENVYNKHGIVLAGIGIYSVDKRHGDLRDRVTAIVRQHDGVLQIHGFFADPDKKQIVFDVILDFSLSDRNAVLSEIRKDVEKEFPEWSISVTMDVDI